MKHAAYELSEAGNAQRLVDTHRDHIAFVTGTGWYCRDFDTDPWRKATRFDMEIRAHGSIFQLHTIANQTSDDAQRKTLTKHAYDSEGDHAIRRMIELAAKDPTIVHAASETLELVAA